MSYLEEIKKSNLKYIKLDKDIDPSYESYLNSLSEKEKNEMREDYWRSQEEWVKVGHNGNTIFDFIFGTIK
jgi:hypothetical protein